MMRRAQHPPHRHAGFTLLELLVVLIITGVLLGALLTPLATRIQLQQVRDQQRALDDIRDVLLGFAQSRGYLPCPDTNGNGLENAPCTTWPPPLGQRPELPYATLGVAPTDRWGRRYLYLASPALTARPIRTGEPAPNAGVDLQDTGLITVNERLSNKSLRTVSNSAAAVVVSFGANGFGGRNLDGNVLTAPTGADEIENIDRDQVFHTRIRTDGAAGCSDAIVGQAFCEYDDIVMLIPTPLLLGRLVQAGRLP